MVVISLFSGPSIESRFNKWNIALKEGIVPKEIVDEYENGGYVPYDTPYGRGYFTKSAFEKSHEFDTDLENPIDVSRVLIIYRNSQK